MKQIQVSLTDEIYHALYLMASRSDRSPARVLHDAIATQYYLENHIINGAHIIVADNFTDQRVLFSWESDLKKRQKK